jgi:hypothetical protein
MTCAIHLPRAAATVLALVIACSVPAAAQQSMEPATVRVEIQASLCAPRDEVRRALNLRPRGSPLDVWLFDDAALTLFQHGLRLRLRVADNQSQLTLKVADQDCARLAPGLVPPSEGKCEYDAHGSEVAGAVSLTQTVPAQLSRDLTANRVPLADTLSPAQIRFLRNVAGAWPLPASLRALGPQRVLSYRSENKRYDVDMSTLPAGGEFIEISRKVPMDDVAQARADLDLDLARAKVAICADQSAQAKNKLQSMLGGSRN